MVGIAAAALVSPALAIVAGLAWLAAITVDAWAVRRPPLASRRVPDILSRGTPTPLLVEAGTRATAHRVRVRQASTADLRVAVPEADGLLRTEVVGTRRGRHVLPPAATRTRGPLGLAAWHHQPVPAAHVRVYPDLRTARRLVLAVRDRRFAEPGRLARGPLGLGTDFESIRDYLPDDDIRQVNWPATARVGRPMSNQYRIEQDRDLLCVVDAGRLMAAPVAATGSGAGLTRLDAAVDAAAAVALLADELEDRAGALAFDGEIRRHLSPRRHGGAAVVRALFDLEPSAEDSAYELAFRVAAGGKRAMVLVLTDLLDEAAGRSLIEAVPVLARRHVVVVASCADVDLAELVATPPDSMAAAHAMGVAAEVLEARARLAGRLRRAGARVVESPAAGLPAACARAYLDVKRRARL